MRFAQQQGQVLAEIQDTLAQVEPKEVENLVDLLADADPVFVAGAGRSGLMMRCFAMRLMHLGRTVHVLGETTTPGIQKGELLVIGSGSGETGSLVVAAKKAQRLNAKIAVLTINPESRLGIQALCCVGLPAPSPKLQRETKHSSVQPLGSLFEQSLLLLLETVICQLMERCGQSSDEMFLHHANLE